MVLVGVEYSAKEEPGIRCQRCARSSPTYRLAILYFLAALPMALGLLNEAVFSREAGITARSGQNVAAKAQTLGNQPSNPALAIGADVMRGANGDLLALCSGSPGAGSGASLNCPLGFTNQR